MLAYDTTPRNFNWELQAFCRRAQGHHRKALDTEHSTETMQSSYSTDNRVMVTPFATPPLRYGQERDLVPVGVD